MKHVFSILFLCLIFQSVLATKKSIKMRMAKVAQALKLITDAKEKKLRKLQNTDLVSDTEAGADSTNATVSSSETDTSSTQPSASGTSSTQPSASETSAAQTSASETSSADTNSTESQAAQTSGAQILDTSLATSAPTEAYVDSPVTAPESANATASNAEVPVTKPVATRPKTTTNTKAAVQVSKFHSFSKPTTRGPGKVTFGTFFYFFGRPIVKFIVVRLRIILVEDLEIYKKQLLNLPELIVQ